MSAWSRLLPYPQRALVAEAAAVGVGTAWLLPGSALMHGGGAFILALVLAVSLVALPLIGLEVAWGPLSSGIPRGLRLTRRRWEPLAWWGSCSQARWDCCCGCGCNGNRADLRAVTVLSGFTGTAAHDPTL